MLSALQQAKIDTANSLLESRTALAGTISSICFSPETARRVSELLSQIDGLLGMVVTNEPVVNPAQGRGK